MPKNGVWFKGWAIGRFPSSGGLVTKLVTFGWIVLARSNWHQKEKV